MVNFNPSDCLILIVDDHPENLEVLGKILKKYGYNISVALNGVEAIQKVNNLQPDLILLDLLMPEIDGLQVCKQIKKDKINSEIPIIFLTASNQENNLLRAFELGAADYITKPFKIPELIARIKTNLIVRKQAIKLETIHGKLKESEAKFKTIVDHLNDGVLIVNTQNIVCFANSIAGKILNRSLSELLNSNLEISMVDGAIIQWQIEDTKELRYAQINRSKTQWLGEEVDLIFLRNILEKDHEKNHEKDQKKLIVSEDLDNQKQFTQDLEGAINLDPLTGIFNRFYIWKIAEEEFIKSKTRNGDYSFSLLLIDLDYFKLINDKYGHSIGDQVISKVAKIIQKSLRKSDFLGRFEGEEFIAILPNINTAKAVAIAEYIRNKIYRNLIGIDNINISIQVSIGMSSYHHNDQNLEDILKRSMKALSEAKARGRNKVIYRE